MQNPLPLWIGATSDVAIRRACRLADGFFPQRTPESGTWPQKIAQIRSWVAEEGRDPASFGVDARITISDGTPEDWRAAAEEWRSLGASHLTLNTMGGGLQGPDAHVDLLRRAHLYIERVDALQSDLNGAGRILIRYSGTEALARVMIEGPDRERIAAMATELADLIRRSIGAT